ncbi:hypothetical protein [Bacillus massilinigeriensis]|uniref:hypothetical protein n=1 Tax=Bacillus mediterraneensis TaxID=1805474 RepID=UPI0008F9557B|nr:hypothetical protein [Bacillus mediterraneensis]
MSYDHVGQKEKGYSAGFFGALKGKGIKQSIKDSFQQKRENYLEKKADFTDFILKKMHTYKKVDGLFLWEVDRKLNSLAKKGFKQKDLVNGIITIVLSRKETNQLATDEEKARIETTIQELEGLENLKLLQFYRYQLAYCEKKFYDGQVTRWIELKVTNL